MAPRIGSEVLPLELPAVAQAISDINASGRSMAAALRMTCDNETERTRCIVVLSP